MGKASELFGMDFTFKPEAPKKPVEGSQTAEQLFGKGLAYEEEEISSEGVFEGYSAYLKKTEEIESGGRADAKAGSSSATGLHQFVESTWTGLVKEMGLDYTLEDRKNPKKSKIVMERFTKKNYDKLKDNLGREPENHELYMAHFLGRDGATKFLGMPHDTPVSKAVTRAQFKANPGVFLDKKTKEEKTVGDVLSHFKGKYSSEEVEEPVEMSGFGGITQKTAERMSFESLEKFTLQDAAKAAVLSKEGREAFKKKVQEEFEAGKRGLSKKQLDKWFSNADFYARSKYPKETMMAEALERADLTERQITAIGLNTPFSKVPRISDTLGFVYREDPDRAFVTGLFDANTMVHEKEHLTTQRTNKGFQTLGTIGRFNEPLPQFRQKLIQEGVPPELKKVFSSSNAVDSLGELLANIASYETSLPDGVSIYDSDFAKQLNKLYGEEEAKKILDQAVAYTLTDMGRMVAF